jgi:hypothetical protein
VRGMKALTILGGSVYVISMWKTVLILTFTGCNSYFWDAEFSMHGSLKKGSTLTPQSGIYLKDSWRVEVIAPTMERIAQKLRELHRNNIQQDLIFGISIVVIGALGVLGVFKIRKRYAKKPLKEVVNV